MSTSTPEPVSRRITVRDTFSAISYLDEKNQEQPLGLVTVSNFGNENIRNFQFVPDRSNRWVSKEVKMEDQVVQLGRGSAQMDFLNFTDAQQPLVDAGMTLSKLMVSRTGVDMLATYTYEDKPMDDPWGWDMHLWGDRKTLNSIYPSITVRMTLTPGRLAANYQAGLYRLICTNGAVGELVGGWGHEVRHTQRSVKGLLEILEQYNPVDAVRHMLNTQTPVATNAGMTRTMELLRDYTQAVREAKKSKSSLDAKWQVMKAEFTAFNETTTPAWAMDKYMTFLDALVTSEKEEITMIDLANAYTGAVNSREVVDGDGRGQWWGHVPSAQVIKATGSLARLATLFSNN